MARLEDLKRGAVASGVVPDGNVAVVDVEWHGADAVTLVYRDGDGRLADRLLWEDSPAVSVATAGRPWSFYGDGALFRLVSEAHRIRLAHLFDPVLAVHTSIVEPLLHQITAVYEAMLPSQPLRFLLADDPGAGKTITGQLLGSSHISQATSVQVGRSFQGRGLPTHSPCGDQPCNRATSSIISIACTFSRLSWRLPWSRPTGRKSSR